MKGYKIIHGIAHCQDCDWQETWYLTYGYEARKHHKKTGHEIVMEIGLSKTIPRSEKIVNLAGDEPK